MMWKTVALAAAVAFGLGGAALAEETTGKIVSIDMAQHTIVLDDGNTYWFTDQSHDPKWQEELANFKPGDTVKVVWDTQQDRRVGMEMAGVHQ